MKLTSPAFKHGQRIPAIYTCDGKNINPPLVISEVPPGTKSLALIVDDPDAPAGVWVHWVVWNIRPDTNKIAEGSVSKEAEEGITSFGRTGYGGPCPPRGTHHYFFRLYALDTKLNLPKQSSREQADKAMKLHIIAETKLMGLYERTA